MFCGLFRIFPSSFSRRDIVDFREAASALDRRSIYGIPTYIRTQDVVFVPLAKGPKGVISAAISLPNRDAATVATNLRRLMARDGLTFEDVVQASGLDERTIRGVVHARNNPHARTLHKLASGLGVEIDELFRPVGPSPARQFDRDTNALVESVVAAHLEKFANWSTAEFDELYSRFGTGGQLTEAGVLAAADAMNAKRDLWRQISVILESGEAELLVEFVDLVYRRVTVPHETANVR
jgi:transcriptional regulator with XRE-family HTH domain